MATHARYDHEIRGPEEPQANARGTSWPLALASVGVCLGTAAAISLIGIFG